MSGEVWATPTVISIGGAVPTTYYENVRQNIAVLARGGGLGSLQTAIAASNLALPNETDKVFILDTSIPSAISYIDTTGRAAGNEITLLVSGNNNSIINNAGSPSGAYYPIYVYKDGTGLGNQTLSNGQRVVFTFSGTYWWVTV